MRFDEFWKNFKNGELPDTNMKRFNGIMRDNFVLKEKVDRFINFDNTANDS